jgi:hypothetical protein
LSWEAAQLADYDGKSQLFVRRTKAASEEKLRQLANLLNMREKLALRA